MGILAYRFFSNFIFWPVGNYQLYASREQNWYQGGELVFLRAQNTVVSTMDSNEKKKTKK